MTFLYIVGDTIGRPSGRQSARLVQHDGRAVLPLLPSNVQRHRNGRVLRRAAGQHAVGGRGAHVRAPGPRAGRR